MANNNYRSDVGAQQQQPLRDAKQKADHSGPRGQQPNQVAEKANMKRQEKQMHKQDK